MNTTPAQHDLVITGADGCVGTALVTELVRRTPGEAPLTFAGAVHAEDAADLAFRHDRLAAAAGRSVTCHPLELTDGVVLPLNQGGTVVHSAGITNFRVTRERAMQVNVEGTRATLDAARRAGAARVVVLSSLYATGLVGGVVPEGPIEPSPGDATGERAYANFYEESKWLMEQLVCEFESDFDEVSVIRPGTVLMDDASGRVSFSNAVHHTLLLAFIGRLTLLPGRDDTPLFLVISDGVAEAIANALEGPLPRYANLAPTAATSTTLGQLLEWSFEGFRAEPDFKRRRVPLPLLGELQPFEEFADAIAPFADNILGTAMRSLRPFAPQLLMDKEVETTIGDKLIGRPLSVSQEHVNAMIGYVLQHGFPQRKPRRA